MTKHRVQRKSEPLVSEQWRCCRSPGPYVLYLFEPTMWFDPDWTVLECIGCRSVITVGDFQDIYGDPCIETERRRWEQREPGRFSRKV